MQMACLPHFTVKRFTIELANLVCKKMDREVVSGSFEELVKANQEPAANSSTVLIKELVER